MGEYIVELYVPRGVDAELRRAAVQLPATRWILMPEDEIGFLLFEAASIDDAREAARLAGLPFERISEAVTH